MRRLALLPLGVAIALGGCSAFVSLDGLLVPDAGTDAGAMMDTSVVDSPSMMDAPDAGPDVFDFVCPDASIVCDDFDDAPLGMRWTSSQISGLATMALDDAGSVSPPNALMLTLAANPGFNGRNAYLAKNFTTRSTVDCDFDVKIDTTSATTSYDVRPIQFNVNANGYNFYQFWLNLAASKLSLEQDIQSSTPDAGEMNPTTVVQDPLDTKIWHHIHIGTDFKRVKVDIDNVPSLDRALADPIGSSSGNIHFGLAYDAEPPSWTYRLDDVYCR